MNSSVHAQTPALNVTDPRGLAIRRIAYHRAAPQVFAERRITLSRHAPSSQMREQWDPRLFACLDHGHAVVPSQTQQTALSGKSILDKSADAGWRLTLFGDAGQPLDKGSCRTWPGRRDRLVR
ncbi:hypothetical protein [Pseudomonas huaxiensis]|uniref:hypothetical protein n=1 Tax=Pseudomonas huaxiensis TaxID=2213017 RepID=UPI000DA64D16|nr:hypothetical protein [Pseudomonas huaxiensis]